METKKKSRVNDFIRRPLVENEDYYFDNGLMVMTEKYLLERGYCCGNGCRHCPYPEATDPLHKSLK